ncbi:MAG: hypothetical protein AAGF83_20060 [Cyanobacteria bacterium P01_G01_bin.67]
MTIFNNRQYQAFNSNLDPSIVNYLERKFRRTSVHLPEVPSYFYLGNKSKLEVTIHSNPQIAKIDVRIIGLKNYDREPAFECSYDLAGLSASRFQREIDDLISRMD